MNLPIAVLVALVVMLLCVIRIIGSLLMAVRHVRRHGSTGLGPIPRWRLRAIKYLIMLTPAVAVVGTTNTGRASAQDLDRSSDETAQDACLPPIFIGSSASSLSKILVSSAVGAGILWRLRSKRQQAWRDDEPISDVANLAESDLASTGDELAIVRLDLALRSLESPEKVRMIIVGNNGLIRAEFADPMVGTEPWVNVTRCVLELNGSIALETLALMGADSTDTSLMFPVGRTLVGEVWINLEWFGSFGVDGEQVVADRVWDGLRHSLSLSPFARGSSLITTTRCELPDRRVLVARNTSEAVALAQSLQSSESSSVLLLEETDIVDGTLTLFRGALPEGGCGLQFGDGHWKLQPWGLAITPVGCVDDEIDVIRSLIGEGSAVSTWPMERWNHQEAHRVIAPYTFVAAVLGTPEVRHRSGRRVEFEKSKSEELVMWLAMHPTRQRRTSARTDMWCVPIENATFSNVTSDVRRSLAVAELPPDGEQWLGVTMTDDLPLHRHVVSDVDILRACVDHARREPEDEGAEVLRQGLSLVRGAPMETGLYIWGDSAGLATDAAMLVVRAAQMLAEMCAESGDVDGVYWATGQGLLAVPGHEDLVAQRMRLHAERDDQGSLKAEWLGYCRAVANDPWGDAAPSHKMVELWRQLTRDETGPAIGFELVL